MTLFSPNFITQGGSSIDQSNPGQFYPLVVYPTQPFNPTPIQTPQSTTGTTTVTDHQDFPVVYPTVLPWNFPSLTGNPGPFGPTTPSLQLSSSTASTGYSITNIVLIGVVIWFLFSGK